MSEKYTPVWLMLFLAIFYTSTLQANQTGPQRIITLSPHLAELVFLLGAGDEIHGVSEYSDYPETVADFFGPWATLAAVAFMLVLFPLVFLYLWGIGGKYFSTRWEQSAKDGKDT